MDEHLCNNKEIILSTAKQLEEKSMAPILQALDSIEANLTQMSEQKEAAWLKDKHLAN